MKPVIIPIIGLLTGLSGFIASGNASGQTTTPSVPESAFSTPKKEPAETDETKKDEPAADPVKEKLKEESAELDKALVGAWVLVGLVTDNPKQDDILAAAKRCLERPDFKTLEIEPGAVRKFPNIKSLFGDLIYFRTEAGLQRFDLKKGQITLVRKFKKTITPKGFTVWGLSGNAIQMRIRFSIPQVNRPNARFMIEEAGFYLRCPQLNPNDDEPAQTPDANTDP